MNIRRLFRLSCLSVAGFFWASCGDDSNSQAPAPEPEIPDPESSSDASGTVSSSSEKAVSSAKEEASSSSETASSSSSVESKQSSSSAGIASSSSKGEYILASDTSVTCDAVYEPGQTCVTYYTCEDYQKYLGSDTTIAESLLMKWENKLENCGAVTNPVALYGVMYRARENCYSIDELAGFKCSNDSTYAAEDFVWGDSVLYRTMEEFEAAYGISSSSAEDSSSSSENMVKNCPQSEFSLFADILADVQGALYEKIVKNLEENTSLTESQKAYLEGILDRENKKLKGNFAPYLEGDYPVEETTLGDYSVNWFSGYVAKKQTCADGTPQITESYKVFYDVIYDEALELLNEQLAKVK